MSADVRLATEADVDGIARVGAETWPATYLAFTDPGYVRENLEAYWSVEALRHSVHESLVMLVAEDAGRIVGVVEVGEHEGRPTMWRLYVVPDRQGRGVGGLLLRGAIAALPGGAQELITEYAAGNEAAARWYRGMGFRETHRDASSAGPDVVWLSLRLRPR